MTDERGDGLGHGGNSGLYLILILVLANLLPESRLESTRPPATDDPALNRGVAEVPARLWQDPLRATARLGDSASSSLPSSADEVPDGEAEDPPILLAVHLRGGSYAENKERRLRSRYAVNAALSSAGYKPENPLGLGVFFPRSGSAPVAGAPGEAGAPGRERSLRERWSSPEFRPYLEHALHLEPALHWDYFDGLSSLMLLEAMQEAVRELRDAASSLAGGPLAPENVIPFEWFREGETGKRVLVLWINEMVLRPNVFAFYNELVDELRDPGPGRRAIAPNGFERRILLGPTSSDTLQRMMAELEAERRRIQVGRDVFDAYQDLVGKFQTSAPDEVRLQVLVGPPSSDAHERMMAELDVLDAYEALVGGVVKSTPRGMQVVLGSVSADAMQRTTTWGWEVFSTRATARLRGKELRGDELDADGLDTEERLFFQDAGVEFVRCIGRDSELADVIAAELERRVPELILHRVDASREVEGTTLPERIALRTARNLLDWIGFLPEVEECGVALITEEDSLYAQRWTEALQEAIERRGMAKHVRVFSFPYFRGVDGRIPGAESEEEDESLRDYPNEGRQFDYIRRLEQSLKELEGIELRAVGVIGTDVYDKLQIIQGLRPHFETLTFFTTDLDARFFHDRHLETTRNLVVASFFPLDPGELEGEGGVDGVGSRRPLPFRDSYQVAAYRAVQHALAGNHEDPPRSEVYEIGEYGPVSLARRTEGLSVLRGVSDGFQAIFLDELVAACSKELYTGSRSDVFLAILRLVAAVLRLVAFGYAIFRAVQAYASGRRYVAYALFGLAAFLLVGLRSWGWWDTVMESLRPVVSMAAVLVLIVALVRFSPLSDRWFGFIGRTGKRGWLAIAAFVIVASLTFVYFQHRAVTGMEPFGLFERVSAWPAVFVRLAVIAFAGVALGIVIIELDAVRSRVETQFFGGHLDLRLSWRGKTLAEVYDELLKKPGEVYRKLLRNAGLAFLAKDESLSEIRDQWRFGFLWWHWWPGRLLRSAILALIFYFTVSIVHPLLGGLPMPPTRGAYAFLVERGATFLALLGTLTLVFYVYDATWFAGRFCLLMSRGAEWPQRVVDDYAGRIGTTPKLAAPVKRVELAQELTSAVDNMIYYPAIAMSLLVLSNLGFFDRWAWTPALGVTFVVFVPLLLLCVWRARSAARAVRDGSLERLREAQKKTVGESSSDRIGLLIDEMAGLRKGAFAPLMQHPLLRAVLLPFAFVGSSTLLQFLASSA